mmetsp:Transcript_19438/g.54297  ORF Transcript_19438/g.54297 Transcript_19438/m.54297 type:complete len:201 (+) Transcript_19438:299-901(+)
MPCAREPRAISRQTVQCTLAAHAFACDSQTRAKLVEAKRARCPRPKRECRGEAAAAARTSSSADHEDGAPAKTAGTKDPKAVHPPENQQQQHQQQWQRQQHRRPRKAGKHTGHGTGRPLQTAACRWASNIAAYPAGRATARRAGSPKPSSLPRCWLRCRRATTSCQHSEDSAIGAQSCEGQPDQPQADLGWLALHQRKSE